ncbi:MAG: hypothetical protein QXD89_02240 [Candidatus Aenigmatarchaeota archaeon]
MGKIDTKIYLKAALLTFLVFLTGIIIGWYLDENRIRFFSFKLEELQIDFSNLILEQTLYRSFNFSKEELCFFYKEKTPKLAEEAGKLGNYLEGFRETTKFKLEELELLKNKYFITNLQLWIYIKDLREKCGYNVTTILFFYTSKERCNDCIAQGIVLNRYKRENPDKFMIFALDSDSKIGIISTLKYYFNITVLPTTIINEKVKLEGFYDYYSLKEFIE